LLYTNEIHTATVIDYYSHKITAPRNWKKYAFKEVCKLIGGSQPAKEHFINELQNGYIRLIQIRDYKSNKFATYIPIKLARRFCSKEDIMIGRYGPPIFQILRGLEGAYNVALMKAEPDLGKIEKEFLYYYLQSPELFNYVAAGSLRTAGQDGVRKEHLDEYPVFLPPVEEQQEIVRRIKTFLKTADQVKQQYQEAQAYLDQLNQSILAKAFRGELVPQDPNDEPASVLLERIRAEREKLDTRKKAKGKTEKKSRKAKPEVAEPKQLSLPGFE
jgi:type I restriction enzyme S subunit